MKRYLLFILLGALSTAPAIALPIAGGYISVYTILWIICLCDLFISHRRISGAAHKSYHFFKIWLFLGIISCVFGYIYFIPDGAVWQSAAISSIGKIIQYLIFAILLKHNPRCQTIVRALIRGLLIGMIGNIIWSIIDAIGYYITGVSINNSIFANYAAAVGARYDILSLTYGPLIRSSGFNMDPANVGLFIIVVFSYSLRSKHKFRHILIILSILGIFATGSMTALAGILISSFVYFIHNKKKLFSALVIAVVTCLTFITIIPSDNIIVESFSLMMNSRLEQKIESKNDGDNQRVLYWTKFGHAITKSPISLFVGTGFYTSSYPYLKIPNFPEVPRPYDPEQTYIAMFFDTGFPGLIFFLLMYYSLFKRYYRRDYMNNRDEDIIQYAGIEGSLSAYLFYHYVLYSVTMLILITGILSDNKNCDNRLMYSLTDSSDGIL